MDCGSAGLGPCRRGIESETCSGTKEALVYVQFHNATGGLGSSLRSGFRQGLPLAPQYAQRQRVLGAPLRSRPLSGSTFSTGALLGAWMLLAAASAYSQTLKTTVLADGSTVGLPPYWWVAAQSPGSMDLKGPRGGGISLGAALPVDSSPPGEWATRQLAAG